MALNQLKTLVGSVTQGSADAFAQGTIVTGLQAIGDIGFKLRRVSFRVPRLIGADSDFEVALTQKSFAAIPAFTERSLVAAIGGYMELTTSGMAFVHVAGPIHTFYFDDDMDMVIATDPLYFQVDSTGTSAANTVYVRVDYQEVRLTETQRLAIMNNALTG